MIIIGNCLIIFISRLFFILKIVLYFFFTRGKEKKKYSNKVRYHILGRKNTKKSYNWPKFYWMLPFWAITNPSHNHCNYYLWCRWNGKDIDSPELNLFYRHSNHQNGLSSTKTYFPTKHCVQLENHLEIDISLI